MAVRSSRVVGGGQIQATGGSGRRGRGGGAHPFTRAPRAYSSGVARGRAQRWRWGRWSYRHMRITALVGGVMFKGACTGVCTSSCRTPTGVHSTSSSTAHRSSTRAWIARPTCVPMAVRRSRSRSPTLKSVTLLGSSPASPSTITRTVSACCRKTCPLAPSDSNEMRSKGRDSTLQRPTVSDR